MVIWISISISSLIIFILIIQISTVITIYYEHIIVTVIVIFNNKFYSGVNISTNLRIMFIFLNGKLIYARSWNN